jgi:hypothetical protein
VLPCQGLEHRGLHDPAQQFQAENILGEKVILDEPAKLGTILSDDREIIVVQQRASQRGFSLAHVAGASFPDDGPGHEQADSAVDHPAIPGDLRIGVLCPDLIAKETRRLAGGVRHQSLGFGQFQLEFIMQEPPYPRLDFLGLALGTDEPEQEVIALCRPRDYADLI